MPDQHPPLIENNCYHLFNRAVGSEKLFLSKENYRYFLRKMEQHILPVADIYAYSLLPNHFHLLVRIKIQKQLEDFYYQKKETIFDPLKDDMPRFVMQQFSNWLNGYTKAFNKMYSRMGGLFMDHMKRSRAEKESSVNNFIFYIHKNAVHHGLTKYIGAWEFDSYPSLVNGQPTFLKRDEVIQWFGSVEAFVKFHQQVIKLKNKDL
ncbi:hypothetical protein A8C56_00780 [Niabella ginsenosidivorans]|uniref:Transposase IS200-like domain-containing protein n=1 Tax=Niabella ginsenosidivorans TaxID=1176587 RepID=A0A1A9HZ45_9BACT|nr:hypothetical protein [Niabella ginsenosidivorans]ANH79702.1 hypothetical protein A8C56_00780 [Niabella ginsenosidivorans]